MDVATLQRIQAEYNALLNWEHKEGSVVLPLIHNGVLGNVDLMTIIGKGRRADRQDPHNRYYLPDSYNRNDESFRKHEVSKYVTDAFAKDGAEIRMKGWEGDRQAIRFICARGRPPSKQQSKTNTKISAARRYQYAPKLEKEKE